jgi:hypothetical protein
MNLKLAKVMTNNPSGGFSVCNYPNPFSDISNIVYSLPSSGHVRVVLTDLYGKQMCVPEDATRGSGIHIVTLNPTSCNLAPGVYLCKVEAETVSGTFSKIIKIVFTK